MPLKKKITEKVRIGDLVEYEKNNKNHTDESIAITKESIHKFGYTTSIEVDEANIILAGHGRKKALLSSGHSEDEMIEVTRLIGYTPAEKAEYRIMANISADQATYNIENVELEVREYDLDTVAEYFDIDLEAVETNDEEEDSVPDMEGVGIIVKQGDIFQLGEHRLMCGDSVNVGDVTKLMNEKKADMVFTDPPYGIDYSGGRTQVVNTKEYGKIMGDKLTGDELGNLIKNVFVFSTKDADTYICVSPIKQTPFLKFIEKIGKEIDAVIVWDKKNAWLGYMAYRRQTEFILFIKGKDFKKGDRSDFDLWSISRDNGTTYIHGTQKPVEVSVRAIENSSKQKDICLDLFLGSGSTLIACEKTNRVCYGMELDPKYVQVILKRYYDYVSGQRTVKCINRKLDLSPILTATHGDTKANGTQEDGAKA